MIVIAALAFYIFKDDLLVTSNTTPKVDSNFTPDPSSATFIFDDGPVTLRDGSSETIESGFVEETTLLEELSYGDINGDDELDTAVLLVRSGGASGVFVYAAAYVSGPVGYRGTNAIFLGDRISPQSVSTSNRIVTVHYLDRREDEPFAAEPTVPASKQFIYRNGQFEER